jgi:hypothetical protein
MASAARDLSCFEPSQAPVCEQRSAPRFTSVLRAGKLLCAKGEFVCLVHDISSSGVRLRCFHAIPRDSAMALELPNGHILELDPVRQEGMEASFRFRAPVPLEVLIADAWPLRRRQLRLNIMLPVRLRTVQGTVQATTINMSRQGCCVESDASLALAQAALLESPHLSHIRARVRWRKNGRYGLVFDDTFSLRDFAVHAARLQCPALTT